MAVTSVSSGASVTGRALNISDHFAAQCATVIDSDYDTCGTITRASIAYLNKNQLDAIFSPGGLFADLDSWFKHSIEMRACGIQRFALYDWIMANADRSGFRTALFPGQATKGGPTILQPFILGKQMSVINSDYWKIANAYTSEASADTAAGATTGLANSIVNGTVTYTATKWLKVTSGGNAAGTSFGTPVNKAFFRPMDTLHIFGTLNGKMQHGMWRVIDSYHNADQSAAYVAVQDINAPGGELYETFSGGDPTNPQVMIRGINNVNDYENWCYNRPSLNGKKMVPFWRQTRRHTRCVDSEYLLVYSRLMESNAAFRAFGELDMAEKNAQDELLDQKAFVNDFFFNKPLVNQDLVNWQSLGQIATPDGVSGGLVTGLGSKLVAYRANFVGVREQLRTCAQVFDLVGNALNLYEWLNINYSIMRARSTFYKRNITDIDWYTNNTMRALFASAYTNYIAAEFPGTPPRLIVEYDKMNKMGMTYDTYSFKYPGGVKINILSDFFFDDWLEQFQGVGQESAGNVMWALDIGKPKAGSIYWAHIAADRRVNKTADIAELGKLDTTFACVMKVTSSTTTLTSDEGTAIVECPLGNAIVEGIRLTIPNTSGINKSQSGQGTSGSYQDLYQ